ncbi:MAG: isoprenyl transferase [Phycisphaerales bacterium]|nr:isoprenyl transferase [Phycisphaerales bacterium]
MNSSERNEVDDRDSVSSESTDLHIDLPFNDAQAIARYEQIHNKFPGSKPEILLSDVHPSKIPTHVAVIMDGNGRWAQERGFPRVFGHRNGTASVRTAIETCSKIGVEVLTLYSFSSENWARPSEEVEALMELCIAYCDGQRDDLLEHNIKVRVIGRRDGMPERVIESLQALEDTTSGCTGLTLCLAINYGSRDEIIDGIKSIARRIQSGDLQIDEIDHNLVSSSLYTTGLPDPDLLIRTGGDLRVSNYLLWQISYSEIFVTDCYWPDFGEEQWIDAIKTFSARSRRFGALDSDECEQEATSQS